MLVPVATALLSVLLTLMVAAKEKRKRGKRRR